MDWKFPYEAFYKTENDLFISDLLLKSEYLEASNVVWWPGFMSFG